MYFIFFTSLFIYSSCAMQSQQQTSHVQFNGSCEHMCCETVTLCALFWFVPGSSCVNNLWISGLLGFADVAMNSDDVLYSYLLDRWNDKNLIQPSKQEKIEEWWNNRKLVPPKKQKME